VVRVRWGHHRTPRWRMHVTRRGTNFGTSAVYTEVCTLLIAILVNFYYLHLLLVMMACFVEVFSRNVI